MLFGCSLVRLICVVWLVGLRLCVYCVMGEFGWVGCSVCGIADLLSVLRVA